VARPQVIIGAAGAALAVETVIGRPPRRPAPVVDLTEHPSAEQRPRAARVPPGTPAKAALCEEDEALPAPGSTPASAEPSAPRVTRGARAYRLTLAAVAWVMALPRAQKLGAFGGALTLALALGVALVRSSREEEAGSILVLVRPAEGARVQANGRPIAANAIVQLPLGTHRLQASAPGFAAVEQQITVAAGTTPPVIELTLAPLARGEQAAQKQGAAASAAPASSQVAPASSPAPSPPSKPDDAAATFSVLFVGAPGAEVQVDGRPVGRTPDARLTNLTVGRRYGFTATRAGFKPFTGQFRSEGAAQVKVAFELEREAAAPTVGTRRPEAAEPRLAAAPVRAPVTRAAAVLKGRLACSTRPAGAQVWVDGRNTGRQTPIALGNPILLSVGTHQVVFKLDGKQTAPTAVTITEDAVAKLINVPLD
ncbi:MAG TPA: PEGA domain-containing protein, partial [Aggregicoccus sp.]|nr:PEGA domain-containing protein [Aggregicoccus sp.]